MSACRLGIAIGRREIALVGVKRASNGATPDLRVRLPRESSESAAAALRKALAGIDAAWNPSEVRIALSPSDLACADLFVVPFQSESALHAVAASLAEGRCAGESAEELAVDAALGRPTKDGYLAEVLAITHASLDALRETVRECLPTSKLILVTSIPTALARTLDAGPALRAFGIASGGEAILIVTQDGVPLHIRSFPCGGPTESARCKLLAAAEGLGVPHENVSIVLSGAAGITLPMRGGVNIEPEFASAWAVAHADLAVCPNLLHGARDVSKRLVSRLAQPLVVLAACAAVLCFAVGAYFQIQIKRAEAAITRAEQQEEKLWARCYPGARFKPGTLVTSLKRTLSEQQKAMDANHAPSALAFWSEVAACMPNPDPLGLSLESLQLEPEGGRLTARVDTKTGDPLGNASALEHSLNGSDRLSARGEFETKDNQVLVRMRLDYRPLRGAVTRTRMEASNP